MCFGTKSYVYFGSELPQLRFRGFLAKRVSLRFQTTTLFVLGHRTFEQKWCTLISADGPSNKVPLNWFVMVCVWFIYWEWPRTDKVLVHLTCSGISNVFEFQISDIPLDNRNARNRNDLAAWRPPLCVVRKPFRWRSCWYTERCSLQLMYNVYIYICIHTIFRKIW